MVSGEFEGRLSGLVVHSDYTGMAGPENMMHLMGEAFDRAGINMVNGGSGSAKDWLVLWAACDNDSKSVRLIAGVPEHVQPGYKPEHFFESMMHKLPLKAQTQLKKMRPEKGAPRHVAEKAYRNQLT